MAAVLKLTSNHHKYEIVRIKAGDVDVIPEQNRRINEVWVHHLARHWDPKKAGVLVLNDRGDGCKPFTVVGQHRALAAHERYGPNYMLNAELYHGLSREQESEIWLGQDTERRAAASLDIYRHKTAAGRPEQQAINEILERYDLHIGQGHGSRAISCPQTVIAAYKKNTLNDLLSVFRAAWPTTEIHQRALQTSLISGMSMFLTKYPNHDRRALVARLSRYTPDNIVAQGRARMGTSSIVAYGVCTALVDIYNKGRRSARLS